MRDDILRSFQENFDRVISLIAVYEIMSGDGQGRRTVKITDILRSATVLLHAALEEVFRDIAAWKYPMGNRAILDDVPLVGFSEKGRPQKFFLGELAQHRGKTVDSLIGESVDAYLGSFNVNNTTDIVTFLRTVGVPKEAIEAELPMLDALISRRHHIVHQADRNDRVGRGHHLARGINPPMVTGWCETADRFVRTVLASIPD